MKKNQPTNQPTKTTQKSGSALEALFEFQLVSRETPSPRKEYRFCDARAWRFDFAWPSLKLAVEIEGGARSGGRHTTGSGFSSDCEKYSAAAILGWSVIRATGEQVKNGQAIAWTITALRAREAIES